MSASSESTPVKRLFVAIPLPDYLKDSLHQLKTGLNGFRWTARDNLHLTLKFIGDTEEAAMPAIEEALSLVQVESFLLPVERIGFFPPRGQPNFIWVSVGKGHPRLFQLHQKIENVLYALGIEPATCAYRPHITIARCPKAAPGAVKQFIRDHREYETAPFKVERFVLCSSQLTSTGPLYSEEKSWPLAS